MINGNDLSSSAFKEKKIACLHRERAQQSREASHHKVTKMDKVINIDDCVRFRGRCWHHQGSRRVQVRVDGGACDWAANEGSTLRHFCAGD
jgi:hypothetical protein